MKKILYILCSLMVLQVNAQVFRTSMQDKILAKHVPALTELQTKFKDLFKEKNTAKKTVLIAQLRAYILELQVKINHRLEHERLTDAERQALVKVKSLLKKKLSELSKGEPSK